MSDDRYEIVVRAEGPGPAAAIRLRRFLKCALRSFGLRCLGIRQIPQIPPTPPPPPDGDGMAEQHEAS